MGGDSKHCPGRRITLGFGFPILYCFDNNVTQILVYCMSHLSLLDYDNPQEKHDERLHTTRMLDFFLLTSTCLQKKLDIPWHVGIFPNGYRNRYGQMQI